MQNNPVIENFESQFINDISVMISGFREGYIEAQTLFFLGIKEKNELIGKLKDQLLSIRERSATELASDYSNSAAKIANIMVAFSYGANALLTHAKANEKNTAGYERLERYVGIANRVSDFVQENKSVKVNIAAIPTLLKLQKQLKDDILKEFSPNSRDKKKTIPEIQPGNQYEYLFAMLYEKVFEKITEVLTFLVQGKQDSIFFDSKIFIEKFQENNIQRIAEIRTRIDQYLDSTQQQTKSNPPQAPLTEKKPVTNHQKIEPSNTFTQRITSGISGIFNKRKGAPCSDNEIDLPGFDNK